MIKVFTANDCSPEFVQLQYNAFQKYMQEEYQYIVYYCDRISKTPERSREVQDICRRLGIETREIPRDKEIEDYWLSIAPGYYMFDGDGRFCRGIGGDSFNYMLQWIWTRAFPSEQGTICFCHSDVFPMEPIKLSDYIGDYQICATVQRPKYLFYIWEVLMLLKPQEIPEMETMKWWPSMVEHVWTDTGGPLHHYFKKHPEVKVYNIEQSGPDDDPEVDFHPSRYRFLHLGDKRLLHYYSGSRWCTDMAGYWGFTKEQSDEYHKRKLAWTRKFLGL